MIERIEKILEMGSIEDLHGCVIGSYADWKDLKDIISYIKELEFRVEDQLEELKQLRVGQL